MTAVKCTERTLAFVWVQNAGCRALQQPQWCSKHSARLMSPVTFCGSCTIGGVVSKCLQRRKSVCLVASGGMTMAWQHCCRGHAVQAQTATAQLAKIATIGRAEEGRTWRGGPEPPQPALYMQVSKASDLLFGQCQSNPSSVEVVRKPSTWSRRRRPIADWGRLPLSRSRVLICLFSFFMLHQAVHSSARICCS